MDTLHEPRLLITPEPESDEGLMGYFLRLTEANGYGALSWIFELAGVRYRAWDAGQHTLYRGDWDTSNLERVTGLGPEEINKLRRRKIDSLRPACPLIPSDEIDVVRYSSPKICPACLEESNYCRGSWNLLPLTACPMHEVLLIDVCPGCGRRISWARKRVSVCNCGFDWRKAVTPNVAPEDLEISRHILTLLDGYDKEVNVRKGNRNPLYTLALDDLCRALKFIADSYLFLSERRWIKGTTGNATCHQAFCRANVVFNDWPVNYHQFFEWVKRRQKRRIEESTFLCRLFAKCDRPSLYFMLIAAEDFIEKDELSLCREWGIRPRGRRFISMTNACRRLGTQQEWLDRLISQGRLAAIDEWGGQRTFVDDESLTTFLWDLGRLASVWDAARILNINPADVESLVLEGCLKPTSGPTVDGLPNWSFEHNAIIELLENIRSRLPGVKPHSRERLISTHEVFHLLKIHGISPGRFTRAVMEGEIAPRKEAREFPFRESFQFSMNRIKKFIRLHRQQKIKSPAYVTAGVAFLKMKKREKDKTFASKGKGVVYADLFGILIMAKSLSVCRSLSWRLFKRSI